ncbi:LAQU0S04e03620g1_1 [Lachancea quebecensis]|uniref:Protoporphyrinogen oxidase n=1 Tax=Lachancea quebecensis TaxID=1654605 RepID=A0A0P1KPI2_9SACH|nr:LAQU0S04e03620g1_1 [Lachancea quebecensis]
MIPQCGKLAANSNVAVVGAGVGGLSFAFFLSKLRPDVSITVVEASKRQGGWINSSKIEDKPGHAVVIEKGPRTLRGVAPGTTLIIDVLKSLNQENAVYYIESKSEANRKFLLAPNDKLVQVPNSPRTFYNFMSSPLGKGFGSGLLGEAFRKGPSHKQSDETAHNFISRRFGNEHVSNNIFSALFHGIYAGDIKKISAKRTLGAMVELEQKQGSLVKGMIKKSLSKLGGVSEPQLPGSLREYGILMDRDADGLLELHSRLKKLPMLGLQNGLETFPKALAIALENTPNVRIVSGDASSRFGMSGDGKSEIHLASGAKLTNFHHIRLTNTPGVISKMVQNKNLIHQLQKVHSNTVVLVNFYLADVDLIDSYHSFGYLVPQSNRNEERLLGVIFDSVIERNFKPFVESGEPHAAVRQDGKYTKLTAMLEGHYLNGEGLAGLKDNSFYINSVKRALSRHMAISQEALNRGIWQVTPAKECLPQFFVGYDDWLAQLREQFVENYGSHVSLGGMAFGKGPGVPDVVMDGFEDAAKLA